MKIELDGKTFLDLPEVVEKTGLNLQTVRGYIKRGKLSAKKVGVKYWVLESALAEMFASGDAPAQGTKKKR